MYLQTICYVTGVMREILMLLRKPRQKCYSFVRGCGLFTLDTWVNGGGVITLFIERRWDLFLKIILFNQSQCNLNNIQRGDGILTERYLRLTVIWKESTFKFRCNVFCKVIVVPPYARYVVDISTDDNEHKLCVIVLTAYKCQSNVTCRNNRAVFLCIPVNYVKYV